MTYEEEAFLDDIRNVFLENNVDILSCDYYHETNYGVRYFCVDIEIDDEDEADFGNILFDELNDICANYDGARLDAHGCTYELALDLS
ncbi:hypothetical protein [Alistipes senegalensis]|jgi:hypothetical protein|uniref:Uncharacterized protein n=1 Tax=Alistipes senegalensis JC50 TaxID=1033732 RepID=A0ABY5V9A8_9BACT|nr:hypothetical protein [Alistipes senegalensis]UEA86164.1 hypothetical protein LK406_10645 [Alistipes senegalensis]UWN66250.1 hypothetical protein NQ519_05300 [Alistipes senegalensis JC50]